MNTQSKIYVAGHRGLVGSAIVRALEKGGYHTIITASHSEIDLCNQMAVDQFIAMQRPEYIFVAAARVGGIFSNIQEPATFLYENTMIAANVIHAAYRHGVHKVLFLGSSCIYPRNCPQPITEESLLTGPLEATNEAYAIAKITGLKLCQAYNTQYGAQGG